MSINGVAWESGSSIGQIVRDYNTVEQPYGLGGAGEEQDRSELADTATTKNNSRNWVARMGKAIKSALLAHGFALTATNM